MKVDINYLRLLKQEINKINKVSLKQIEWFDGIKKIEIDDKILEEFKFTGLANEDFILSDFYKTGFK
jgi:hypothetical protein